MGPFIPGLELNRLFHQEVLAPLLAEHFPGLRYSAGLMGEGSDVLAFDDERSMDHNWGPRGVLFLSERDAPRYARELVEVLRHELPYEFRGFSTNFTTPQETYLVQQMKPVTRGPVNHMVRVFTVRSFFEYYLGFTPSRRISVEDWLTFPQQALLEVTGGEVFHDGLGALTKARERFAYYPRDLWLYVMRCQWGRIANELSYQARSGEGGDELGSLVLAARMVDELVRLAFMQERRYVPYSKWRGRAFLDLDAAPELHPILLAALRSTDWRERQQHFAQAFQLATIRHNALGVTDEVSTEIVDFHGRGYPVVDVGEIIRATQRAIHSRKVRMLKYHIGSVDQFISHARINHERYLHRALRYVIR
ncbi:DUF4037 domain-containing protein [Myxococcota bacterium]|nr:DUF4037 domain-containing protein [Myxococcota bacterium]